MLKLQQTLGVKIVPNASIAATFKVHETASTFFSLLS